jgi:hypothetical protein
MKRNHKLQDLPQYIFDEAEDSLLEMSFKSGNGTLKKICHYNEKSFQLEIEAYESVVNVWIQLKGDTPFHLFLWELSSGLNPDETVIKSEEEFVESCNGVIRDLIFGRVIFLFRRIMMLNFGSVVLVDKKTKVLHCPLSFQKFFVGSSITLVSEPSKKKLNHVIGHLQEP